MSSQETKNELAIAKKVASLEDKLLPTHMRPSSCELTLIGARQGYWSRVESEDSYDQLVRSYRSAGARPPVPADAPDSQTQQELRSVIVANIPRRDALVEYRERHGLDTLREQLMNEIAKAASFDAGIEFLADHIDCRPSETLRQKLSGKGDLSLQEKVELAYPDLNADEVSWLALVNNLNSAETPWIGDVPCPTFYPPSLVGIDPTGLLFAHNVDDVEDHGSLSPKTAEEVTGVTGNDGSVFHYPFRHNVAAGIKALILLSLNEGDVFKQLKEDESVMAMRQGDSLLLRTFLKLHAERFGLTPTDLQLKISDIVNAPSNRFTREDLESLRHEVALYLRGCDFLDIKGESQAIHEVVQVLGLLERTPSFIERREPFRGITLFYAGEVQFVDLHGKLIDSVPIVEHLRNQFGYRLSDSVDTVNIRAETTRLVFEELDERIRDTNIRLDNKMKLDRLQEELLLQHRIAVPIRATWWPEEASSAGAYYAKNSAEVKYLRRFLKFGDFELSEINRLFTELPQIFTRGVHTLRKGAIELRTESILTTGNMMLGCYNPADRSVCINVPEFGPQESREYSMQVLLSMVRPENDQDIVAEWHRDEETILKTKHNFFHTLVHELAESVAAAAGEELVMLWSAIDLQASKAEKANPRKLYVSRYATTSPKEDFCESCAVYFLAGQSFRELAKTADVLSQKYQFLKRLFSSDGIAREFRDRYPHHMYEVIGDPALPWEQIVQEHFAVQFQTTQEMAERDIRDVLSDKLVSYEDVADVIRHSEALGESISREEATRIALDRQREQNSAEEELASLHRIFLFVSDRITLVTQHYKVSSSRVSHSMFEIIDALFDGDTKALRRLLVTTRDKPISIKSANEIVARLQPLIKAHTSSLDDYRARYMPEQDEEALESSKRIIAALAAELQNEKQLSNGKGIRSEE